MDDLAQDVLADVIRAQPMRAARRFESEAGLQAGSTAEGTAAILAVRAQLSLKLVL